MCYSRQTNVRCLVVFVLLLHGSFVKIVDCLSLIIFACILDQFVGHWLLLDALNFVITMSFKIRDEMHLRPSFETRMDDDIGLSLKLATFASNIKLEVFGVLYSFFSFLRTYEEKKACNILLFMFDLRLKKFRLVFSYVGKKQGMYIVESMI